jgi:predicted RNA-binding Zn-ribbon protein involved in translation (DUF1610 family)
MDGEELRVGWDALSAEVARELTAWRAAHPKARLEEIEGVVAGVMRRLQARYLEDLVHTSVAADLAPAPDGERPRCPACGGVLESRGRQEREVLTPKQAEPLRLRRSYAVCSACGAGLFPPG